MTEKKLNTVELTDEELGKIQGGYDWISTADGNHFYEYVGRGDGDRDRKYLCPKCGKPVHLGTGWRYYCDSCDESWFWE